MRQEAQRGLSVGNVGAEDDQSGLMIPFERSKPEVFADSAKDSGYGVI